MQGTPTDLSKSGVDFAELVGNNEKENEENADRPMSRQTSRQLSRKLSRSISASTTSSVASLNISADGSLCEVDKLGEEEEKGFGMEASSKGKVKGSIAANYFAAGANWFWLIILAISFLVVQLLASAADYWVSIW